MVRSLSTRTRVLIVDDSPVVRGALVKALGADPSLEVVGTAENPVDAWSMMEELEPDVLTVDVEMPEMDGLTFLTRVMRMRPMPVIIVSSKARRSPKLVLDALQAGALAVVPKPHAEYPLPRMIEDLKATLKGVAKSTPKGQPAKVSMRVINPLPPARAASSLIAVGSSTGGTVAFEVFAAGLPSGHPCVLLAQHLPVEFVQRFVDRLGEVVRSKVSVAKGGEVCEPDHIYVAPGTHHLRLRKDAARPTTELWDSGTVNFHRPSVDVLMHSVAAVLGKRAGGVMLTGMGADGAKGMLAMRQAGAMTVGQDEASSVVYGMPRAAHALGAVMEQLPPERLAGRLLELMAHARA